MRCSHGAVRFLLAGATVGLVACGGAANEVRQAGAAQSGRNPTQCARRGTGESADRSLAACLTSDDAGVLEKVQSSAASVTVFVDRSASMQGFLDPAYPSRIATDYRSVIDNVLVGVHPTEAFSFGSEIRPINATLGTLADRSFYSDHDTETEAVLRRIAADTARRRAYVIVTDGRRGSPDYALNQYVELRQLAQSWVDSGGALIVAASMAPFSTVAADPSGCRREGKTAVDQRCPLYAFALAPRGSERWLVSVLASAFEHVYAWPAMRMTGRELALISPPNQSTLQFERNWGPTPHGSPIVRSHGKVASNTWVPLKIAAVDTSSLTAAGVLSAMRGQRMNVVISSRRFGDGQVSPWSRLAENTAIVRSKAGDPMTIEFITRGEGSMPSLYRIDVMPEGSPSWLDDFDAANRDDRMKTYGLDRLFEGFRQQARTLSPDTATLARFYVVAN